MTEGYSQVKRAKDCPTACHYVYIHRRASDNLPFYVGKGNKYRAWVKEGRSGWWQRVVAKHGLIVEIVFEHLEESEAFQCERDTILELSYFNYPLVNLTAGGEGGLAPSKETRDKQSLAKLGKYTGIQNPFADRTLYEFSNTTLNLNITCTRSELSATYGVPNSQLKKLFGKTPRNSVYGWTLKG